MKSKTSFTQMLMILLTLDACDTAGIVKPAAETANGRSQENVTAQLQADYASQTHNHKPSRWAAIRPVCWTISPTRTPTGAS